MLRDPLHLFAVQGRVIYWAVAILALAGIYTCWCGTPLIWDGAYQFSFTLINQTAYQYGTRFHSAYLWQPVLLLSKFTNNTRALVMVYGLPYTLAPAAGLMASWWVVRRQAPWLIVWALFGIAIAPLPGQIFIINDSIFQQHMFWPVFLGMLVPLDWPKRTVLAVLALFQLSHPIGMALLAGTAGGVALLGYWEKPHRREYLIRAAVLAVLAVVAYVRLKVWPDSYAAEEAKWYVAQDRWRKGVAGAPFHGMLWMWGAAAMVLIRARLDQNRHQRWIAGLAAGAFGCVLIGAMTWLTWASVDTRWKWALDYRRWLVPLTFPFFAFAYIEAMIRAYAIRHAAEGSGFVPIITGHLPLARLVENPAGWNFRGALGVTLAATFAAVLGVQSVLWLGLTRRLMDQVHANVGPVVRRASIAWADETPLNHWGIISMVMVLQGKEPEKVLLYDEVPTVERMVQEPDTVPYNPWENLKAKPGKAGWYDNRPIMPTINQWIEQTVPPEWLSRWREQAPSKTS